MTKSRSLLKKTALVAGLFLTAVFCFLFIDFSHAQTASQGDPGSEVRVGVEIIQEPLGLPATDIRLIVARIVRAALGLIGIVLVVLLIYAGYLWMTAGGNEEQIESAKKIIKNATVGLIIILSAYAIVLFVMRLLGVEMGDGAGGITAGPGTQNYAGSGALGRVIKDHYPERNQIDVPRNTKIVITFFRPIQVSNLAIDTNNNGVIGDCRMPVKDWETDCDALIMDNDLINISQIIKPETSTGTPTYQQIRGAAFLAASSTDPTTEIGGIYTIVIRPYDYLGSELEDVPYLVRLGNDIRRDDVELGNPGIFASQSGSKFYQWSFTCGTELDLTPPHVSYVYPDRGAVEYKNTVIQIGFNEPIDPIGVQGIFVGSSYDYYYLENGFLYLKNEDSTVPLGAFNLVNNYRTLEFTPSIACGKNACGGTVYCMPVCDEAGATCQQADYQLLVKAATTISEGTFESQPFTGVADMSGNALDGNADGSVDSAPTNEPVFDNWKAPDNYWWNFVLKDEMDLIPPIVSQVTPGPEAPWIEATADWSMWFDKRMRIEPMYSIDILETPTPEQKCACFVRNENGQCVPLPTNQCVLDQIWKAPRVFYADQTPITRTRMNHGEFLVGYPQGYVPQITSNVEDVHFNCLYPGQGPLAGDNYDTEKISGFCDKNPDNCCIKDDVSVLCCNGLPVENDSSACVSGLLINP